MKKKLYVITCVCAGLVAAMMSLNVKAAKTEDTIANGVFADEVDLSGMTQEEADKAITSYVKKQAQNKITVTVSSDDTEVELEKLGLEWKNKELTDEALAVGKSGNPLKRYKERRDLEASNKVLNIEYTADKDMVETFVKEECTKFNQEAVDAGLKKDGASFTVIPGHEGVVVSEEESVSDIISFVENDFAQGGDGITLTTQIDEPKGTEEELAKVKDALGTFTTSYSSSSANRCQNVANGANLINGTVVYPGDTFSTYKMVNPFTESNGYAMAGTYVNGKVEDSLGGGICQVSTTLYNAALRAEMDIVERSPHSMSVAYVPLSADAAIAGTYKDFKFKNNTDAPVYIEGSTSNKKITFTIYGQETRASNRKVDFESETLSTTPSTTVLVADGGQGIGYRTVESGHTGYTAKLYKLVYVDGELQSRDEINSSTYKVSNRTITYGVVGDDGQLGACIAAGDEAGADAIAAVAAAAAQAEAAQ